MEWVALSLFCLSLLVCVAGNLSILFALCFGLILFMLYGRHRGFSWSSLLSLAFQGVKTVHNILITFFLIGVLTAMWRAAGTIPEIVCLASQLIHPSIFLLMTFLLNSLVSTLTGTSFGTAATMGVICATMGSAMGVPTWMTGGAVLSGAFFGDRCSPLSTSALLVSELTKTSIYDNIRNMIRTALLPFVLCCLLYTVLGTASAPASNPIRMTDIFSQEFSLHPLALLPAALILVLSAMHIHVKIAMTASILCALPIALFLQHIPASALLRFILTGYEASSPKVAPLLNGGGITSMLRVFGIVCLSSSYSFLFRETGLLDPARHAVFRLAEKTSPFAATLCTSILSGVIACNQTLTVMLTHQLCGDLYPDSSHCAIDLEDTAIVIAPLIPWSIAGAVPLAAVGAPSTSILLAFFLYLLPLYRLISRKERTSGQ